jgi:hypothetical protein
MHFQLLKKKILHFIQEKKKRRTKKIVHVHEINESALQVDVVL